MMLITICGFCAIVIYLLIFLLRNEAKAAAQQSPIYYKGTGGKCVRVARNYSQY